MFKIGLFKEPESLFRSLIYIYIYIYIYTHFFFFFFSSPPAVAKLGWGQAKFAVSLMRYQLNVLSR